MKTLFLLPLCFVLGFSFSQVKFGKIDTEELSRTQNALEPDASAEIISKSAHYSVSYNSSAEEFEVLKEVEVRIKIYDRDKAPDRLLNIEIPAYYVGSNKEKISNIRATTYNLENGKTVESKVANSDIFTEKIHDYLAVEKFAFPNVKNGSVLEYKYTILTPRIMDLDTWFFQAEVPVMHSRLYFEYPEFFHYQQDRRGEFTDPVKTQKKNTAFNYKSKVDILEAHNMASLRNEPFIQNTDNLRSSIRYELVEFNNPGFAYKNFATTWEAIVNDLFRSENYGSQLKGNNFLDKDIASFEAVNNPLEKMNGIFEFVKAKYTWDGYTGLYPEKGVRKTFSEKSGNGTDLNFILINMLNKAGIKAYPVVLSTVENGVLNFFPSRQKLNHTITAAVVENKIYLMDPIEKLSKINMLPQRDLNFKGFMMLETGKYQELELFNTLTSEIKNQIVYKLEEDVLTGNFIQVKNNYYAMSDLRNKIRNEKGFEGQYLSNYDMDVTEFQFQENNARDAIRYTVAFEDEKSMQAVGNKLFIKPLLFLATESNAFQFRNAERKFPLEFGTPFTHVTSSKLEVPEGYTIESMPENFNMLLPQNAGGFDIKFTEEKGNIVVTSLLHVSQSILPQNFYTHVRNMFQEIVKKENEQIILVKN